jgi:DNA polymerase III subunit delta'
MPPGQLPGLRTVCYTIPVIAEGQLGQSWPVVGHEWAASLLQQAILGRRPSHAYMFSGPASVGKTTLARAFSQALECENQAQAPCGRCRACRLIALGRYSDVQVIAAEKNAIQIDQIRNLQADAALSPLEGRYRVFIVREIERATAPAANALLKTLEEPPARVIMLLTSARRDMVLPTILSRCQLLGLRPLPEALVESALCARWQVPAEQARLLARLSAGRLGWAVSAYTAPRLLENRTQRLGELQALPGQNDYQRLAYTETLSRQPAAVQAVLSIWATWWRDLLLVQQGLGVSVVNLDWQRQLEEEAARYRQEQVQNALLDVAHALRRINANVNVRLALDVLALRLPHPAHTPA